MVHFEIKLYVQRDFGIIYYSFAAFQLYKYPVYAYIFLMVAVSDTVTLSPMTV